MNFRTKIILDRVIARPFAILCNAIVWPLGKLLRRDHDAGPGTVKVIVCAKIVGIGSILRATPMIRALRRRYPQATIVFITSRGNAVIMNHLPCFDQVIYLQDTSVFALLSSTFAALYRLWRMRVDLYFDLEVYSAFSTLLATASCARNRYGFYRTSALFRLGLHTHLVYFNDSKPISRIYLSLAAACGTESSDIEMETPVLSSGADDGVRAYCRRRDVDPDQPYCVINPNASELMLERRWPLEYFSAVMDALSSHAVPMFIVGSADERNYAESLFSKLSERAKALTVISAGEIAFEQVMRLLKNASCFLTNDSGLFHVALSLKTPTVSLWGPGSVVHYAEYPYGTHKAIHNPDIYCSPCIYRVDFPPCRGNNKCMKSIAPRIVYRAMCELLAIPANADHETELDRLFRRYNSGDFTITVRR